MNYLTFDQVVQRIPGMTSSKLRRWVFNKKLPFPYYKTGKTLSFRESEVDGYIDSCKVPNTSQEVANG